MCGQKGTNSLKCQYASTAYLKNKKINKKKSYKTIDIHLSCEMKPQKVQKSVRVLGELRFPSKLQARTEEMGRQPQSGGGKKNR